MFYDLIRNIRREKNIRRMKLSIYISRTSFGNSKPCYHCINTLKSIGIYRVFYTTGDNNVYKCEKINNIENEHVSRSNK